MEPDDTRNEEVSVANGWGQEGGIDAAAELLRHYDRVERSWDLPRIGEFWDAVDIAHSLGRHGDGHVIAVVDDGFDLSIPALAAQTLMGNADQVVPSAHGTVVALLILAVAPDARLLLFPTALGGKWDPVVIQRALYDVERTPTSIVNLSLGAAVPASSVIASDEFLQRLEPWPEMSEEDLPFWISQGMGELNGWRDLVRPPSPSIFTGPIAALQRSGRTVVAATGNARGYIFDPAFRESVISASFKRIDRTIGSGMEEAVVKEPTYSQSEISDFGITQPAGVLGSSFAAPLISGFAALVASQSDLRSYSEVARLAGLAEQLMVSLPQGARAWSERRDGVVDELFLKAVRAVPHWHSCEGGRGPCPECALFAVSAFVNYGLFKLNWGDLEGAELLLGPAERFAPTNPHAAANLGMVYALRARQAQAAGNFGEVVTFLRIATRLQQKAVDIRPDHEPYKRRVAEFIRGARHPQEWRMAP